MPIKVTLHFNKDGLRSFILQDVASRLNNWLNGLRTRILPPLENRLFLTLSSEPEGISLQGGSLQGELGVTKPVEAIRTISRIIILNMLWEIRPVTVLGGRIKGGLSIGLLRTDLSEILSLPVGTFVSEGGSRINWLEWLLTQGVSPQVRGYRFNPQGKATSRTGLGTMSKAKFGVNWRVPAFFAGTSTNNWVTRGLDKLGDYLLESLLRDIKSVFG